MWKFLICIELLILLECLLCQNDNYDNHDSYDKDDGDDEISKSEEIEDCFCAPFYECALDGYIRRSGENMVDPRSMPQEYEISQNGMNRTALNCTSKGFYFVECCKVNEVFEIPEVSQECGMKDSPRIVGRVLAKYTPDGPQYSDWPWQAAILENNVFICGATFIGYRHVLTVAHCVERLFAYNQSVTVRLGKWDVINMNSQNHKDYSVSEIILHPQYRPKILYNDIAILKLAEQVRFHPHINSVCFPTPDDYFVGQNCIVTGWGTNKFGRNTHSKILKEITLPIISNEQCEQMLRKTKLSYQFKLHDSFICAGGKKGKDACTGDGGGPLVCLNSDDSYTLVGLVSWGIGCGSPRVPGVYVNVQMFLNWIQNITEHFP